MDHWSSKGRSMLVEDLQTSEMGKKEETLSEETVLPCIGEYETPLWGMRPVGHEEELVSILRRTT